MNVIFNSFYLATLFGQGDCACIGILRQLRHERIVARGRRLLLDHPFPLHRTKMMTYQWLNHDFWPEPTCETSCSYLPDPGLFADVVASDAQPAGNNWTTAFLTRKRREVQVVGGVLGSRLLSTRETLQ